MWWGSRWKVLASLLPNGRIERWFETLKKMLESIAFLDEQASLSILTMNYQ
jgi:hypothetical protein